MPWQYYNPNPKDNLVGDCVIRALTLALNEDWDKTYLAVSTQAYEMKDAAAQGWSRDYARDYSNGYTEDYSNAYGNMTRRGRDSMGRYTSRGGSYDEGYSRHSKEEMIENLKTMMMNARTPEERESYRATIEQMQMSK